LGQGPAPIIRLPELSPGTLILEPVPYGFERPVSVDLARLGAIAADRADGDGRELVVIDGVCQIHLRLRDDGSTATPSPCSRLAVDNPLIFNQRVAENFDLLNLLACAVSSVSLLN
jgi:hypothetical protein